MRKKVLIYPGNSYSAEEIYWCLKYSLRYEPVVGNHGSAHLEYIAPEVYFGKLPLIFDSDFFVRFNELIARENISFVIPAHDTVAEFLTANSNSINCTVVCSCAETASICRHKRKTYEVLDGCPFVPRVYDSVDASIEFPLFAKDDIGQGGKNSCIVNDFPQLKQLLENSEIDYVITEYLPGDEITVDCFTDRHGTLLFCQPRARDTILTGMSGRSHIIHDDGEVAAIGNAINSRIKFQGYWYFQCKRDSERRYKLMEVSTRFAGTYCLSKNLDVNFPVLALSDKEGIDISIIPNEYGLSADRGYKNVYKLDLEYETVYFDFDDTLVSNRTKYIVPTMAFLFQCLNKGKKTILLTRHAYDIYETLENLHIDRHVFYKVVELEPGISKAEYIDIGERCILIDNSFAERADVKSTLGIPTFDICNLDCLIDAWS